MYSRYGRLVFGDVKDIIMQKQKDGEISYYNDFGPFIMFRKFNDLAENLYNSEKIEIDCSLFEHVDRDQVREIFKKKFPEDINLLHAHLKSEIRQLKLNEIL